MKRRKQKPLHQGPFCSLRHKGSDRVLSAEASTRKVVVTQFLPF